MLRFIHSKPYRPFWLARGYIGCMTEYRYDAYTTSSTVQHVNTRANRFQWITSAACLGLLVQVRRGQCQSDVKFLV